MRKKKPLSLLIVLLGVLLFCAAATADAGFPDAAKESALKLEVDLFDTANARAAVLELPGYPDAPYCLFLPADCDRTRLKVSFPAEQLSVNGKALFSGEATDVFAEDGVYTVSADGKEFSLQVFGSEHLPSVYISTESGSLDEIHADKAYKEPGTLTIINDGEIELEEAALSYVKGRGNTSWAANEKRSYNIKLKENTALLGMKEAKKWVLTSNNTDPTLMRNAIIYTAAQLIDLPYTVDFRFVDLYINGNYRGNYILCEKIEVRENRIDVTDLDKANEDANPELKIEDAPRMQTEYDGGKISWFKLPNEPENITGGYLLEYEYPEQFETEPSAFISKKGQCLILHSPEYATQKEMEYLTALYNDFEEALYAKNGKNHAGKHYSEYIDMDSFIDAMLLQEYSLNQDMGHTSWYLVLPGDENRFYMGPLWDFDSGMEDADAALLCDGGMKQRDAELQEEIPSFISLLFRHRDFADRMAQRYAELEPIFREDLADRTAAFFEDIKASALMNRIRWGDRDYSEQESIRLQNYVPARAVTMKNGFEALAHREKTQSLRMTVIVILGVAAAMAIPCVVFTLRKKRKTASACGE